MNVIGIVCEYNPFHLGHAYQLNKIKEMFQDSIIIVVCSTNFTQRGDVSIINKWDKTKIALECGVDIVVELPFGYATQSSDIFAKGALEILNYLQIDTLIFGSESDNVDNLIELANTQFNNHQYNIIVKKYLNKGINYPTALSKALLDITNKTIDKPNDLLGLAYVKEILKNNYNIKPISIKRTNDYHGTNIDSNIINASLIRDLTRKKQDVSKYIPNNTSKYLCNTSINDFFPYLKYQILTNSNKLYIYQTVDEGIENRIIKVINNCHSYEELIDKIKTKRYTYNKINRMLLHILTNFTKEEAKNLKIDYIRLLGFNHKGQLYLNKIKKELPIPILTKYKPHISTLLDIEQRTNNIYAFITNNYKLIELEYNGKPIIKIQ